MTTEITVTGELRLSPITLSDDYATKWNTKSYPDFSHLTRNGEILNNNALYRVGGMDKFDASADYNILLKYTESFYEDKITKNPKEKPHLKSEWVIVDKNGVEKVIFKEYGSPYLIKNSCIYSFKNRYYNIETGYMYADYAGNTIQTENFILLGSSWDTTSCIKINKRTGEFEVIP